jgi:hypothetical protein
MLHISIKMWNEEVVAYLKEIEINQSWQLLIESQAGAPASTAVVAMRVT